MLAYIFRRYLYTLKASVKVYAFSQIDSSVLFALHKADFEQDFEKGKQASCRSLQRFSKAVQAVWIVFECVSIQVSQ
jgi:hypothetical protein